MATQIPPRTPHPSRHPAPPSGPGQPVQRSGLQRRPVSVISGMAGAPMGLGLAEALAPLGRTLARALASMAQGFRRLGQRVVAIGTPRPRHAQAQPAFTSLSPRGEAFRAAKHEITSTKGLPELSDEGGPAPVAKVFLDDQNRNARVFIESGPPRILAPVGDYLIADMQSAVSARLAESKASAVAGSHGTGEITAEDFELNARPAQASASSASAPGGSIRDGKSERSAEEQARRDVLNGMQRRLLVALGGRKDLFGAVTQVAHQGFMPGILAAMLAPDSPVRLDGEAVVPTETRGKDKQEMAFGVYYDAVVEPDAAYVRVMFRMSNLHQAVSLRDGVVDLDPTRSSFRGEFVLKVKPGAPGQPPSWSLVDDDIHLQGQLHRAPVPGAAPVGATDRKSVHERLAADPVAELAARPEKPPKTRPVPVDPVDSQGTYPELHSTFVRDLGATTLYIASPAMGLAAHRVDLYGEARREADANRAFDALERPDQARSDAAKRRAVGELHRALGGDDALLQAVADCAHQGTMMPFELLKASPESPLRLPPDAVPGAASGAAAASPAGVPIDSTLSAQPPAAYRAESAYGVCLDPSDPEGRTALVRLTHTRSGFDQVSPISDGLPDPAVAYPVDPASSRYTFDALLRVRYERGDGKSGEAGPLRFTRELVDFDVQSHIRRVHA